MERDFSLIPKGECIDDGRLSPVILVVNKYERRIIEAVQGPFAELLEDPETEEIFGRVHGSIWDRYPYDLESEIDLIYVYIHAEGDVKRKIKTMLPQYTNWDQIELVDFRKVKI